jgi:hypothetical protein
VFEDFQPFDVNEDQAQAESLNLSDTHHVHSDYDFDYFSSSLLVIPASNIDERNDAHSLGRNTASLLRYPESRCKKQLTSFLSKWH